MESSMEGRRTNNNWNNFSYFITIYNNFPIHLSYRSYLACHVHLAHALRPKAIISTEKVTGWNAVKLLDTDGLPLIFRAATIKKYIHLFYSIPFFIANNNWNYSNMALLVYNFTINSAMKRRAPSDLKGDDKQKKTAHCSHQTKF